MSTPESEAKGSVENGRGDEAPAVGRVGPAAFSEGKGSIICPSCSVILKVRDGLLPPPIHSEKGDGWWFSCSQCNHHWWHAVASSEKIEDHEHELRELRRIVSEFDLKPFVPSVLKTVRFPEIDNPDKVEGRSFLSKTFRKSRDSAISPSSALSRTEIQRIKDYLVREVRNEIDQYTREALSKDIRLRDPRNRELLNGRQGESFFPTKNWQKRAKSWLLSGKNHSEKKGESDKAPESSPPLPAPIPGPPQELTEAQGTELPIANESSQSARKQPPQQHYSYRRVLPDEFLRAARKYRETMETAQPARGLDQKIPDDKDLDSRALESNEVSKSYLPESIDNEPKSLLQRATERADALIEEKLRNDDHESLKKEERDFSRKQDPVSFLPSKYPEQTLVDTSAVGPSFATASESFLKRTSSPTKRLASDSLIMQSNLLSLKNPFITSETGTQAPIAPAQESPLEDELDATDNLSEVKNIEIIDNESKKTNHYQIFSWKATSRNRKAKREQEKRVSQIHQPLLEPPSSQPNVKDHSKRWKAVFKSKNHRTSEPTKVETEEDAEAEVHQNVASPMPRRRHLWSWKTSLKNQLSKNRKQVYQLPQEEHPFPTLVKEDEMAEVLPVSSGQSHRSGVFLAFPKKIFQKYQKNEFTLSLPTPKQSDALSESLPREEISEVSKRRFRWRIRQRIGRAIEDTLPWETVEPPSEVSEGPSLPPLLKKKTLFKWKWNRTKEAPSEPILQPQVTLRSVLEKVDASWAEQERERRVVLHRKRYQRGERRTYIAVQEEGAGMRVMSMPPHQEWGSWPPITVSFRPVQEHWLNFFSRQRTRRMDERFRRSPKQRSARRRIAMMWGVLLELVVLTALSVFWTYQNRTHLVQAWTHLTTKASSQLELEHVHYAVERSPQFANVVQVVITGEIVNTQSNSQKVSPILVKILKNPGSKPLYFGRYFHRISQILPYERSKFQIRQHVVLPPNENDDLRIELAFE